MSKKILVTGSSGFIGHSLANYFSYKEWDVTGLSRRITDNSNYIEQLSSYTVDEIASMVSEIKPAAVIHAAGTASVNNSILNPAEDYSASVELFRKLLEGVRISGQKPIVTYLSSASVYGNPKDFPVNEEAPLNPISPYGFHKVICEVLAREYTECYAIPTLVVRLFSVFGPRQNKLLVWELFDQFINKPEVIIQGTGRESRDYLYIDDLAQILFLLMQKVESGHTVVNMASGTSVTVEEIAEKIKEYLHSSKPISYLGKVREGHPLRWQADISRQQSITGEMVYPSFGDRLKELIGKWTK